MTPGCREDSALGTGDSVSLLFPNVAGLCAPQGCPCCKGSHRAHPKQLPAPAPCRLCLPALRLGVFSLPCLFPCCRVRMEGASCSLWFPGTGTKVQLGAQAQPARVFLLPREDLLEQD